MKTKAASAFTSPPFRSRRLPRAVQIAASIPCPWHLVDFRPSFPSNAATSPQDGGRAQNRLQNGVLVNCEGRAAAVAGPEAIRKWCFPLIPTFAFVALSFTRRVTCGSGTFCEKSSTEERKDALRWDIGLPPARTAGDSIAGAWNNSSNECRRLPGRSANR